MIATTISALAEFPSQLEHFYRAFPQELTRWTVRGLIHYLCSHDQQHLAGLQWLMGKAESARPRSTSRQRLQG